MKHKTFDPFVETKHKEAEIMWAPLTPGSKVYCLLDRHPVYQIVKVLEVNDDTVTVEQASRTWTVPHDAVYRG